MKPKVSILVATYNGEKFLRKQLDSIVNQTYQNLEIIIQDDGSNDSTFEILNEYAEKDDRISASKNKKNLGIIQNFYDLISKSSGDYIAISDQDDIWEEHKIEVLLENIEDSSLIYTDSALITDDDSSAGTTLLKELGHTPKSGKFLTNLCEENTISGHACLFNSDLKETVLKCRYMKFRTNFMYDQLIGVIASYNNGVKYYDTPLTLHRIHTSNNHNTAIFNSSTEETKKKKPIKPRRRSRINLRFFERKKRRARIKIRLAYAKLILLEIMFNTYYKGGGNPFATKPSPKDKFRKCFFNQKLYEALIKTGMNKKQAISTSRGRLFYIFFKIF